MITIKTTRAKLAQRRRIELYKKVIVFGFLLMTILPMITSIVLFHKISGLENDLEYALSNEGADYLTYRSSKEALANNPNASSGVFAEMQKPMLGSASSKMNQVSNTEEGTERKRVYLTFDDGPSNYTGQILDILAANDVKATFFVIGKSQEYHGYYKRIVDEGHTIGLHSFSHVYTDVYESLDAFKNEIQLLRELIYDVTGEKCNIFRFPGGSSNQVSQLPIGEYVKYLNEEEIKYYDWNALNGDAVEKELTPEELVDNIMIDVSHNQDSIVLMHDLQTTHATVESLQLLIDTLKSNGYEILPIDEKTPLIQHVPYDAPIESTEEN